MANEHMRGLSNFIGEIRKCKTPEAEKKRVDKELAHIRSKFSGKKLDSYNSKKYVWKLLYITLLGHQVDVGHMEALKMITEGSYSQKLVGYMACAILLHENADLLRLIIQSVRNDLTSPNEVFKCLALNVVANVGGQEFAESLTSDVQQILFTPGTQKMAVRKKAALALLRLLRRYPEGIPTEGLALKLNHLLETDGHGAIGLLTCTAALMLGLVSHDPTPYTICIPAIGKLLYKLRFTWPQHHDHPEYRYYHTICPWLQIKLLRLLQYMPPEKDPQVSDPINQVLGNIVAKTEVYRSVNKNNADHGVLFEAINVVIHYATYKTNLTVALRDGHHTSDVDLLDQSVKRLCRFLTVKEPNIKYLGLDHMTHMNRLPDALEQVRRDKKHIVAIKHAMRDPDISIRKRALDLLYTLCDKVNAQDIVDELTGYLSKSDYEIKEELVLKIAILAEKYAPALQWYIDVIIQLITIAGDFVSEDIWYRVVQIVTNHEELQEYAATKLFAALQAPNIHENGIKLGGYILGEFGHTITDESVTGEVMFNVLYAKFSTCGHATKALLLSSFIKMANTFPELAKQVDGVFEQHKGYVDPEIQQRALEYASLHQTGDENLLNAVFEIMPNFPERESALIKRIQKSQQATTDRDVWSSNAAKQQNADAEEEGDDDSSDSDSSDSEDSGSDEEETKRADDGLSDDDGDDGPAPQANTQDLLGFGFDEPVAASSNSSAYPPQKADTWHALLGKDSGVLYDCPALQIGLKVMAGVGSQAKMILYYGNKSTSPLQNLSIEPVVPNGLEVHFKPAEPMEVAASQQIPHYVLWKCSGPFQQQPQFNLNFTHEGSSVSIALTIPLSVSHFCKPLALDSQGFVSSWKQHSQANEMQVVKGKDVVDLDAIKKQIQNALHLSVIDGLEKDVNNFSASGSFETTSNAAVPVLCRFETKPNTVFFRLTVHSTSKAVSQAVIAAACAFAGMDL